MGGTISVRLNENDYNLIQKYVSINNLNISSLVREALLDKIEEDTTLDEARILSAKARADAGKVYDHTEVWKMLGV